MRRDHLLFGGIGCAGLLFGLLLLPKSEEHATMLARDGLYEAALVELAALRRAHPDNPQIVMQSHMLRTRQGDIPGALETMRDYLSLRPKDETARERYAELLLQSGRIDEHLSVLAGLAADFPSSARIERLAALYRLHGRHDDELELLTAFAGSRHLDWRQLERLGALLAARSDLDNARRWLDLADQRSPAAESDGRLLLLDVLIEQHMHAAAMDKAADWIKRWRSPFLASRAVLRFAQSGDIAAAGLLAAQCVELLPGAGLQLASNFALRGQQALAQSMLAAWAKGVKALEPDDIRDFVYASRQAGDLMGPVNLLARLTQARAAPAVQAALAEEMARPFGMEVVSSLRQMLPDTVFDARPLFGAELAISEGNMILARHYFNRVDLATLNPGDRASWLSQLQRLEAPGEVLTRLATLWSQGRLPKDLVPFVAAQAKEQGQYALQAAVWTSRLR